MRLVTNLMIAASLVFAYIFLQAHYDIKGRFWQWWNGGTTQSNGPAAPASSAWPTSGDHDYRVIIDVSGKGPFMSVIHGPESAAKKLPKRRKKSVASPQAASNVASQQGASKDQPQATPQPTADPPRTTSQPSLQPGTKLQ
jgi:hypothetical protein